MNEAWAFAARAWDRPGVAVLCLELQDRHGQCAPLLLWRLWALAESRPVDPAATARAVGVARAWSAAVIEPLRAVRGRLGAAPEPVREVGFAIVRERLMAAELEGERVLMTALEAITAAPGPAATVLSPAALIGLAEAWRPPAPVDLLTRLMKAI